MDTCSIRLWFYLQRRIKVWPATTIIEPITVSSTYPIGQKDLPTIPECNSCHNSNGAGKTYTDNKNPGLESRFCSCWYKQRWNSWHTVQDVPQCMHNITIKDCHQLPHHGTDRSHNSWTCFSEYTTKLNAFHATEIPHKVTMQEDALAVTPTLVFDTMWIQPCSEVMLMWMHQTGQ